MIIINHITSAFHALSLINHLILSVLGICFFQTVLIISCYLPDTKFVVESTLKGVIQAAQSI